MSAAGRRKGSSRRADDGRNEVAAVVAGREGRLVRARVRPASPAEQRLDCAPLHPEVNAEAGRLAGL